ncbi:helix-turn-helix domain-containing protein [Streptomyces sodiiphilus]|uniref:Helix-turn-helix domain-containing protein n=1 Tax=Streptomyces sodiiphilus TaxID=226217 RepID=A0ABN2PNZ9_9ACTN
MYPVLKAREAREAVPSGSGSESEAKAVLRRTAGHLLDRLPQLTDEVVALIRKNEPAYRERSVDPDALWQEVHRSLHYNVGCLVRPREMRESARRYSWRIGTDRAEQGLPLDAVLHAFRLGGGAVWQSLLDTAARRDPDGMRLLVHVAGDVWNFVDEHCSVATEAYRRTERELSWRRENKLRLMTEALLKGTVRISELPEIAAALDLPERARYAVAAVSGPARAVVRTGHGVPRSNAAVRLLWQPADGTDLGIVLLGEGGPEQLARDLTPPAPGLGVRVGLSPAVDGLASIGQARTLAEKALLSCPADGEVALLHDHLPAALVVSSPELSAVLTERVLGPLLRLEPADRDLMLDTLTAWLECDASAQRAGERLSCHRNTVLNRLRRYERLTGRSLGRPLETAELSLALTARKLLGL